MDSLKELTILYVEDEKEIREAVSENISPFIKKLFIAKDGREALKIYIDHKNNIDIIISDIFMPKINGMKLAKAIRKNNTRIPIIFTTAFNDLKYLKEAADISVDGYVLKPIDFEELIHSIEKVIKKVKENKYSKKLQLIYKSLKNEVAKKSNDLKALNEELKKKNKELIKRLYTDELTGIGNRKAVIKELLNSRKPFLTIIDIDSFNTINSFYGTHIGSYILKTFAKFLSSFAKEYDMKVFRTGSDEFILLKNEDMTFSPQLLIQKLSKEISELKFYHQEFDLDIDIDVTMGISIAEDSNPLKYADLALKQAKKDRLSYLFYKEGLTIEKELENDIKWTKIIKKAIDEDRITVFFQPIVNFMSNKRKYESLMRLVLDDKVVSPYFFLDIAKKSKLYPKLTKIVIDKVFNVAKKYDAIFSINLSVQDINNDEIVDYIIEKLNEYEVADRILFEIVESESIDNFEKVFEFLQVIKRFNSFVAIDDFGSGYSNFSYLTKLKPDYIKIDGSLIKNMDSDKNAYLIVEAIVNFSKKLGIKTIGEYIHSEDIFSIALDLEIDELQGYFFSEPKKDPT